MSVNVSSGRCDGGYVGTWRPAAGVMTRAEPYLHRPQVSPVEEAHLNQGDDWQLSEWKTRCDCLMGELREHLHGVEYRGLLGAADALQELAAQATMHQTVVVESPDLRANELLDTDSSRWAPPPPDFREQVEAWRAAQRRRNALKNAQRSGSIVPIQDGEQRLSDIDNASRQREAAFWMRLEKGLAKHYAANGADPTGVIAAKYSSLSRSQFSERLREYRIDFAVVKSWRPDYGPLAEYVDRFREEPAKIPA